MSWLEGARTRLRLLFARRSAELRMNEEMRFHIEMETERLVRAGHEPREARRLALVAFGGVENYREQMREGRGLAWLTGMSLDLKLGVRMLGKHPGLTLIGCLALSVAIGTGAAYLELLNDVFHPSLRGAGGDRIVRLDNWDVARSEVDARALHDFVLWREELKSVEELGAVRIQERNLITSDGRTETAQAAELSASIFRIFGTAPLLGRPLLDGDEHPGAPAVAVIGESLWKRRFQEDPRVIGRTARIGTTTYTIVGVMPSSFGFPATHNLWLPFRLNASEFPRGQGPDIGVVGRLASGASLERAQAELSTLGQRVAANYPDTHRNLRPGVVPMLQTPGSSEDDVIERRIMYGLNLFFIALLCVCCANVATLVFARTASREGEITVRNALGASRGRIVAQLFAEALVLAALAAAVGLLGAGLAHRFITRSIISVAGSTLPFWWNDRLSAVTVIYAVVLTLIAATLIGVIPAIKATSWQLQARLRNATGGSGMQFGGIWTVIIVSQVALTVVFLLIVVSVGWNARVGRYGPPEIVAAADHYLSARLQIDDELSPNTQSQTDIAMRGRLGAAYEQVERRLAAEPGVIAVTFGSRLPGMANPGLPIELDGMMPATRDNAGNTSTNARWVRTAGVAVNYFTAFNAPIVRGRAFHSGDLVPGRNVVIVDETFAREILGDRNPIGMRLRQAAVPDPRWEKPGPWLEIVGVVSDLTSSPDKAADDAMIYRPAAPGTTAPMYLAVQLSSEANRFAPRLSSIAASVDPDLRLHKLQPLSETRRAEGLIFTYVMRLLVAVFAIALLLATAGVYSLMSYTVARRTREIGIRAALGADPRRIISATFARGLVQVGLGVLAGSLPGAALVAFGAPEIARGAGVAGGVFAFLVVALFMLTVGMFACYVPARRALRIPPTDALRA